MPVDEKAKTFYKNTIEQQFIQFCVDWIDGILSSEAYLVLRGQTTGFTFSFCVLSQDRKENRIFLYFCKLQLLHWEE